jgi:hypothetical protein
MEPTSRRKFIRNTSVAVAAAGVTSAIPTSAVSSLTNESAPPLPEDDTVNAPVVAHVRDVRKGKVALYTGEREATVTDKRLARLLYHATR